MSIKDKRCFRQQRNTKYVQTNRHYWSLKWPRPLLSINVTLSRKTIVTPYRNHLGTNWSGYNCHLNEFIAKVWDNSDYHYPQVVFVYISGLTKLHVWSTGLFICELYYNFVNITNLRFHYEGKVAYVMLETLHMSKHHFNFLTMSWIYLYFSNNIMIYRMSPRPQFVIEHHNRCRLLETTFVKL